MTRRETERAEPARAVPAFSLTTKLSSGLGIVAAMVLAAVVNVFVARHYKRWDLTRGGLYTLSDATVQTVRAIEEPLQIYVLLPDADPLTLSIRHLLEAYRGETSRLEVVYTDPDRHPAEFMAIQQRYGIVAGRTEDGRVVTDTAVIVVRGEKHHFLTAHDLVDVEDENDLRARPRLEQALTSAIRTVASGDKPKACFATGHGEGSLDVGAGSELGNLEDKLTKNNFEVVEIPPARSPQAAGTRLADCRILFVSGPTEHVPPEDVQRMVAYIEGGGNAFVAVSPVNDADNKHFQKLGLDELFALGGLRLQEDFVFERDPEHRSARGPNGETFMPIAKPHAITEGLLKTADRGVEVVMTVASSMTTTGGGSAAPAPLLVTTDSAFGMVDFFAWAEHPATPTPAATDHKGPVTVAFAAELPKRPGGDAQHGPRMVFVSSASVLFGANWQSPELRGTRVFVQSAIGWLAARPAIVDVPPKPSFTAGLLLDEAKLASVYRYAIVFIPLFASAVPGIAILLLRRRASRRPARRERPRRA